MNRLYNVDFYIQIGEKYIGIQIKPITNGLVKHIKILKKISVERCLLFI